MPVWSIKSCVNFWFPASLNSLIESSRHPFSYFPPRKASKCGMHIRLTQVLPANHGGEVEVGIAMHSSQNPTFQVRGPALIQPAALLSA